MKIRYALATAVALTSLLFAQANITGQWTATFDTEVGQQSYTFDFVVKGTTLTGTLKGNLLGESKIADGKVEGQKITFTENASFMEMPLRITYVGELTSAGEIKFTRNVADLANEQLVAKRVK